jgi:chromosome segregation ATPase
MIKKRLLEAAAIVQEIEGIERELATLRVRVDQDQSLFASLEQQIFELRMRLGETQDALQSRERRLSEKKAELAQAQRIERLEGYEDHLAELRESRGRAMRAAEEYMRALESYDDELLGVRKLLEEMRDVFGSGDERAAAVDAALASEPRELSDTWKAVAEATQWRVVEPTAADEQSAEAAQKDGEELSKDLQRRAEDGRASRILDYFNKD